MSEQESDLLKLLDSVFPPEKPIFDCDSFYEAADNLLDQPLLKYPYWEVKEQRYEPDGYKRVPLSHVPFIKDASIALVYFVRQLLCVILGHCGTEPYAFPVVIGLQCFEIDDVSERRRIFDLQFSNHEKDNQFPAQEVGKELQIIEARRDLFKRFAAEKPTEDPYDLLHEADKAASVCQMGCFEEYVNGALRCDKKFLSQLIALEMNLYGIRQYTVPKLNDWAFGDVDSVLRNHLLDFLEFATSLSTQPAEEAAKYICIWSTLVFRLISRSVASVEKALKNFRDLYVSITGLASITKSYSLPFKDRLSANFLDSHRITITAAGLEILCQADNCKAMKLLKRSRKLCYVDALKYSGMMAVRLACQAAGVLNLTVEGLCDMLLDYIGVKCCSGIRNTCHLLKLLLRDFSSFDSCDSWMYARAMNDGLFISMKNKFHRDFICFCCYVIEPRKRPGVGVWAIKYPAVWPQTEEELRKVALFFRQARNVH